MDTSVNSLSLSQAQAAALAQQRPISRALVPDDAAGSTSFALALSAAQSPKPTQTVGAPLLLTPAPLPPPVTAATPTPDAVVEETAAPTTAPVKISRSARMECAEKATQVVEDDNFTLDDLIDLVNPLQHIPVVGTIYREITGDKIKPEVQVTGSILFGLVTGSVLVSAASGILSAVLEQETGKEPMMQVADALFGSDTIDVDATETPAAAPPTPPIRLAEASPAAPEAPASVQTAPAAPAAPSLAGKPLPVLAATGGMRIGNTIYTSPLMRSAAKVPMPAAAPTPAPVATTAVTAPDPAPDTSLGTLIHQQALAHESGQALPPELVQDMMLRALDKYKTAQTLTPAAATP